MKWIYSTFSMFKLKSGLTLGLILTCTVFFILSASSLNAQTLQQCQNELSEYKEITELAKQQIDDLTQANKVKKELIEKHKLKIQLLEKRIALLQNSDEVSVEMVKLLEENQDICLATEQQAYTLMNKIMEDYKEAVKKATRPWYLDPSFYGGILIGALVAM